MRAVDCNERHGDEAVAFGLRGHQFHDTCGSAAGTGVGQKRDIVDIVGVGIIRQFAQNGVESRNRIELPRMADAITKDFSITGEHEAARRIEFEAVPEDRLIFKEVEMDNISNRSHARNILLVHAPPFRLYHLFNHFLKLLRR